MSDKIIKVAGTRYSLAQNFDLVERIEQESDIRVRRLYRDICQENERAVDVVELIACSLRMSDENALEYDEARGIAQDIYDQLGMIKSALLVHDLLGECMAGKIDAKKLRQTRMYSELTTLISSQFPSLSKVMLLWVGVSLISAGSLCGIFSIIKLGIF